MPNSCLLKFGPVDDRDWVVVETEEELTEKYTFEEDIVFSRCIQNQNPECAEI